MDKNIPSPENSVKEPIRQFKTMDINTQPPINSPIPPQAAHGFNLQQGNQYNYQGNSGYPNHGQYYNYQNYNQSSAPFYYQQLSPSDMFIYEIHKILKTENNKKFYQNKVLDIPCKKLSSYNDINKIKSEFQSCTSLNDPVADYSDLSNAVFFVLRSTCDDDIHKAIKYGFWTSTHQTNMKLNETLRTCSKNGIPVFLLFTVVNSQQFCGLAQMVGEVEADKIYNYWWEDLKWSGVFPIRWVYVKDIPHTEISGIQSRNQSIASLKDGEEI